MKLVVALLLMLGLGFWSHGRFWTLADQLNPWAPLAYEAAPDWLTRFKLQRLKSEPAACQAFMATTP
ncbi:MAG: extensin, partial [Comamonas sp.]